MRRLNIPAPHTTEERTYCHPEQSAKPAPKRALFAFWGGKARSRKACIFNPSCASISALPENHAAPVDMHSTVLFIWPALHATGPSQAGKSKRKENIRMKIL
jgi:hypothetical protein